MKEIKIYGVWGLLSHEKEYCFTDIEPIEESFDEFEVTLPEGYDSYISQMDDIIIETPDGYRLTVAEAFRPGQEPRLATLNGSGFPHSVKVKYRKLNDEMKYNARYL